MPTEKLTQEEHPPGKTPPVSTAPRKKDKVGAAARGSPGAQRLPHWLHSPHGSVLWLLVGRLKPLLPAADLSQRSRDSRAQLTTKLTTCHPDVLVSVRFRSTMRWAVTGSNRRPPACKA